MELKGLQTNASREMSRIGLTIWTFGLAATK